MEPVLKGGNFPSSNHNRLKESKSKDHVISDSDEESSDNEQINDLIFNNRTDSQIDVQRESIQDDVKDPSVTCELSEQLCKSDDKFDAANKNVPINIDNTLNYADKNEGSSNTLSPPKIHFESDHREPDFVHNDVKSVHLNEQLTNWSSEINVENRIVDKCCDNEDMCDSKSTTKSGFRAGSKPACDSMLDDFLNDIDEPMSDNDSQSTDSPKDKQSADDLSVDALKQCDNVQETKNEDEVKGDTNKELENDCSSGVKEATSDDQKSKAGKKRKRNETKNKDEKKAKDEDDEDNDEDGTNNKMSKNANHRKNIREILEEDKLDVETREAQKEELQRIKRVQEAQQRALIEQQKREESQIRELIEKSSELCKSDEERYEEEMVKSQDDIISLDGSESDDDDQQSEIVTNDEEKVDEEVKQSSTQNICDVIDVSSEEEEDEEEDEVVAEKTSSKADVDPFASEGFSILKSTVKTEKDEEDEDEEEDNDDPENSGTHTDDAINQPDEFGRVLVNVGHPDDEDDIFIASQLNSIIKPHQIGGVRFLYDNIIESTKRFSSSNGFGCILAHSMGLGKTLQVITFVDVFLRHTAANKVLIVAPINTIQNWFAEFDMWIPPPKFVEDKPDVRPRNFKTYTLLDNIHKTIRSRQAHLKEWFSKGGVMLMGYEMYRLLTIKNVRRVRRGRKKLTNEVVDIEEEDRNKELLTDVYGFLVDPGPDLIVCDEGHRIKNNQAGVAQALKNIKTRRRVVLTGYPLQNNLIEYWCMVDFSRPNYLGSKAEFCNMFERPIMNGQCADSTARDKQLMKFRAHVLHSLLLGFVQRRSHSVLRYSLPSKEEHVLMIRLTPLQRKLYNIFMEELKSRKSIANPLKAFAISIKICNHPDILYRLLKNRKIDDNDLDLDDSSSSVVPGTSIGGPGSNRGCKRGRRGGSRLKSGGSIRLPRTPETFNSNLHNANNFAPQLPSQSNLNPSMQQHQRPLNFNNNDPTPFNYQASNTNPYAFPGSDSRFGCDSMNPPITTSNMLSSVPQMGGNRPMHLMDSSNDSNFSSRYSTSDDTFDGKNSNYSNDSSPFPSSNRMFTNYSDQSYSGGLNSSIDGANNFHRPEFKQFQQESFSAGNSMLNGFNCFAKGDVYSSSQTIKTEFSGKTEMSNTRHLEANSNVQMKSESSSLNEIKSFHNVEKSEPVSPNPLQEDAESFANDSSRSMIRDRIENFAYDKSQISSQEETENFGELKSSLYNVNSFKDGADPTNKLMPINADVCHDSNTAYSKAVIPPLQDVTEFGSKPSVQITNNPIVPKAGRSSDDPDYIVLPKEKEMLGYDWALELMKDYKWGCLRNSCKMTVLFAIIEHSLSRCDRLLIFSQSLYTLDLIEEFLQSSLVPHRPECEEPPGQTWIRNYNYYRLDGSTSAQEREKMINIFNVNKRYGLFLLSTRAGCLGINLIGANRVVIYDASWNPCHDAQAICRVYRYGQIKPIHVYRLVTDNTLERKIYERQVTKRGMSDRVVDELNPEAKYTTVEVNTLLSSNDREAEEQDLSKFCDNFEDPILKWVCREMSRHVSEKPFEHESLLLSRKEEKLTKYEKKLAKQSYEFEKRYSTYNRNSYTTLYANNSNNITTLSGTPARIYNNIRFTQPMSILNQHQPPVQSTPLPMRPFRPTIANIGGIDGNVDLSKQGVTVQKITINKELSITASKPGVPPIVIPSGKQVLVLRTSKGVYLRTPEGKVIAVKLPPGKAPGPASTSGTPAGSNSVTITKTSKEVIDITGEEDNRAANVTITPAVAGQAAKGVYNVNRMMHTSGGAILQKKQTSPLVNSTLLRSPINLQQQRGATKVVQMFKTSGASAGKNSEAPGGKNAISMLKGLSGITCTPIAVKTAAVNPTSTAVKSKPSVMAIKPNDTVQQQRSVITIRKLTELANKNSEPTTNIDQVAANKTNVGQKAVDEIKDGKSAVSAAQCVTPTSAIPSFGNLAIDNESVVKQPTNQESQKVESSASSKNFEGFPSMESAPSGKSVDNAPIGGSDELKNTLVKVGVPSAANVLPSFGSNFPPTEDQTFGWPLPPPPHSNMSSHMSNCQSNYGSTFGEIPSPYGMSSVQESHVHPYGHNNAAKTALPGNNFVTTENFPHSQIDDNLRGSSADASVPYVGVGHSRMSAAQVNDMGGIGSRNVVEDFASGFSAFNSLNDFVNNVNMRNAYPAKNFEDRSDSKMYQRSDQPPVTACGVNPSARVQQSNYPSSEIIQPHDTYTGGSKLPSSSSSQETLADYEVPQVTMASMLPYASSSIPQHQHGHHSGNSMYGHYPFSPPKVDTNFSSQPVVPDLYYGMSNNQPSYPFQVQPTLPHAGSSYSDNLLSNPYSIYNSGVGAAPQSDRPTYLPYYHPSEMQNSSSTGYSQQQQQQQQQHNIEMTDGNMYSGSYNNPSNYDAGYHSNGQLQPSLYSNNPNSNNGNLS